MMSSAIGHHVDPRWRRIVAAVHLATAANAPENVDCGVTDMDMQILVYTLKAILTCSSGINPEHVFTNVESVARTIIDHNIDYLVAGHRFQDFVAAVIQEYQ